MKWVARIIGGILGVIGVIVGLTALFGERVLPKCDDSETYETLRQVAANAAPKLALGAMTPDAVKAAVEISETSEVSFDEPKQTRECKGVISLTANTTKIFDKQKIAYTITWTNRDKGEFQTNVRTE